jgi:hypothetical protein
MGKIIPIRRATSERLLCEWRLVAERAVYVADLVDELGDDAEAAQLKAELYIDYLRARANYQGVSGEPVPCAPCAQCHILTRSDCLDDISDVVALAGPCCESCAAELVHEAHAELDGGLYGRDPCGCTYCEIARGRWRREMRAADARVRGGLTTMGLRLVGLDGED